MVALLKHKFEDSIQEGARVLSQEADALNILAKGLDENFHHAIEIIEQCQGRLIVTGMGKSGHIARKIAATLASTGTPSFFVHPAEASHGDLGMIDKNDSVLALSYSGETAELMPIVKYVKRYEIPLLAITGEGMSSLSQAADASLILPKIKEACPIALAPTTSTTLMLALGDAFAAVLLKRKRFSSRDFQIFHPSGALGKRLRHVADIMHKKSLPLIPKGELMKEALLIMSQKGYGCIGVIDASGRLVGVVTDGDLRRHIDGDLLNQRVEAVMTPNPQTITSTSLVEEGVAIMNRQGITALFVVDSGATPTGLVHIHDCLRKG